MKDAEWIADLVRHGLVCASFVPAPDIWALWELVRHRKALAGIMAGERNRTLQLLEGVGIKLAGVMSDVFGVSGMLMLRALAEAPLTAAISAAQAKGTFLRDKFHRLKARIGAKKAAMAMAHKILVATFHMLQRGVGFADLGADYLDRLDKHRTAKRLTQRLTALGYDVMLRPRTVT